MSTQSPTISLSCTYTVCAGHRLLRPDWSPQENLRVFGKCANSHGHHYTIVITLSGAMSPDTGMLINGYDVDAIVRTHVVDVIDHKFLNDDIPFFATHLPTAEWIAVWAYDQLCKQFPVGVSLKQVEVYETPELKAVYPA